MSRKDRLRNRQEGNKSRGGSFPIWYKMPEGVELYEIQEKENLINNNTSSGSRC